MITRLSCHSKTPHVTATFSVDAYAWTGVATSVIEDYELTDRIEESWNQKRKRMRHGLAEETVAKRQRTVESTEPPLSQDSLPDLLDSEGPDATRQRTVESTDTCDADTSSGVVVRADTSTTSASSSELAGKKKKSAKGYETDYKDFVFDGWPGRFNNSFEEHCRTKISKKIMVKRELYEP